MRNEMKKELNKSKWVDFLFAEKKSGLWVIYALGFAIMALQLRSLIGG